MDIKRIHEFALHLYVLFADETAIGYQLCDDTSFADSCFSFGFEMDCGNAFMEAYPERNVFNDKNAPPPKILTLFSKSPTNCTHSKIAVDIQENFW
ncbi:MAG: hypothetical protein LIO41_01590 [Ruminococcus sp.]|nr:hypothetical protein [Ruminococcus sp.]